MLTTTVVINTTRQPAEDWAALGVKSISATSYSDAAAVASQLGIDVIVLYAGKDVSRSLIILEQIQPLGIPIAVIGTSIPERIQISFLIRGATSIIPRSDSRELKVYKVKALLKRVRHLQEGTPLPPGLTVNLSKAEAAFRGSVFSLTRKQFDILVILARHYNEFVHRQVIADILKQEISTGDRALDMMVSRTRAKILNASSGLLTIDSEYGLGYRLLKTSVT